MRSVPEEAPLLDAESLRVARAPGRVNLIGEHTDYNEGFVLPVAIDRFTTVAARRRADGRVTVEATDLGETDSFALDAIERTGTWADYVRGVVALVAPAHGISLRISSDVPRGVGLSSSAALEVAVGRALSDLPGPELALLAQRAENDFVGVQCGIMDQFTAANARAGHAMLLDCRDLSYRHIPIPDGVAIVVCDSRIERRLAASGYNERRAACEEAAALIGVPALRDARLEDVERLPAPLRKRARHVVSENERTVAAAAEFEAGNLDAVGRLMDDSHRSMRDDYEIVPAELDRLAAAARAVNGCFGARLTGAGFGGCAVCLVDAGATEAVRGAAEELGATVYVFTAAAGVSARAGG
jgi:galactokinase